MNIINIVLNFFLIYPTRKIFGITVYGAGLSVAGAAIASAISYIVGGILIFRHYYQNKIFLILNIQDFIFINQYV